MDEVGNLVVKITMNQSGFQQGITALNRQLKVAQTEFKAAAAGLSDFGKGTEGLKLKADSLTKQIDIQKQKLEAYNSKLSDSKIKQENAAKAVLETKARLDEARAAYEKTAAATGKTSEESQKLKKEISGLEKEYKAKQQTLEGATKAVDNNQISINNATAQMANLENELKKTAAELEKQTSAWHKFSTACEEAGKKMAVVGRDLTQKVTAPLVGLGVVAAKSAIDFESAFASVRKTVDASEKEFSELRQGFLDMAKTIPIAVEELMGIGEAAGQLGISTENILSFTDVMAKLGVATNLSSEQAAMSLARLANITQMPQDQFDRLGSTVVALGNSLAANESEIVEMGLRLAGAGKIAGMTEANILSFSAALASVGISAEAGGTSLSRVLLEINNQVAGSGENLRVFAAVAGMTADEFSNKWRSAPAGALQSFIAGLKGMRDSGQNVVPVLDSLGMSEVRVRTALLNASGASDVFAKALETGSKAWEENIALNKEAEERFKTIASQLQILKNNLIIAAAAFGELLLPSITKVAESLNMFFDRLSKLDEGTKKSLLTVAAVIASIGPILWGLSAIMAQITKVKAVITGLITAVNALSKALLFLRANPIGLILTGFALLVSAGIAVYKNWDTVKHYGLQAWGRLKVGVLNAISAIAAAYEKLLGWVPMLGNQIRAAHAQVREAIEKERSILAERAASIQVDVSVDVSAADKELADATKNMKLNLDAVVPRFEDLGAAATGAGKDVSSAGNKMSAAAEKTKTVWIGTVDAIKSALSLLQTQHEIKMIHSEISGDKVETLRLKYSQLNEELAKQQQVLAATREEVEKATAAGVLEGETAEDLAKRIDELNKKLADEEKVQAQLEKQIYDTSQELKNQGKTAKDLAGEIKKAADAYQSDMVNALQEYQKKVKETNDSLRKDTEALQRDLSQKLDEIAAKGADRERQVTEQFQREIENRTRSLIDFVGLFEQVADRAVSGDVLLANLEGQVAAFENWQQNLQELAAKGIDKGLLAELREMGPKAAPEIAALNTLTAEQLSQYVTLWKKKQEQARKEATAQLSQQRIEMDQQLNDIRQDTYDQLERQRIEVAQKLQEMQAKAKEELEKYKTEWEKKNEEIRNNTEKTIASIYEKFNDLVGKSTKYGVSLMDNFMEGINSRMPLLIEKLESVASMIDSYMPHSPAKKGPLRRIREWGPAIIEELTTGIRRGLPRLEDITARMAMLSPGALQPMLANSYNTSNTYNQGGNTFVFNVSGGWDEIERELKKRGVRF